MRACPTWSSPRSRNCPVFGGKLVSARRSGDRGPARLHRRRAGSRTASRSSPTASGAPKQALAALPIVWDEGAAAATDSEQFRAEYRAALDGPLANAVDRGDAAKAFAGAAKIVEALYEVPYLAHAPMEPLNAAAYWRPDRIDVWIGTQSPEAALKKAAEVGGVDPRAVFIHNAFLGGGFGRRAVNDELRPGG